MASNRAKNLRDLYNKLVEHRRPYVDRAVEHAKVTDPMVFPEISGNYEDQIVPPFSFGAKAVSNLANKLVTALFPSSMPFFKLSLDRMRVRSILEDSQDIDVNEFIRENETALKQVSKEIHDNTSALQLGDTHFEVMRQLIVAGNALFYVDEDLETKIFKLNEYVLESDHMGKVTRIIAVEQFSPHSIPEEYLEKVKDSKRKQLMDNKDHINISKSIEANDLDTESIQVYTGIEWIESEKRWKQWQEIEDIYLEGSEVFYKKDELPYIPTHFFKLPGETYGRGLVEQLNGYFRDGNGISQAIKEKAAMMSLHMTFIDPDSGIQADEVRESGNGSIHEGNPDGIKVLQSGGASDLNALIQYVQILRNDLSSSFLMSDAIRREGERVTATEIRILAQELEQSLSGVYSKLARTFQVPLVHVILSRLRKKGQLPNFDKDLVGPKVITGISALGRSDEFTRSITTMQTIAAVVGPEAILQLIKPREFIEKSLADNGVDTTGIVKSKEELAQEQQAAQQQQLLQQFGPEVLKQSGGIVQKSMDQGEQSQT